MRNLLSKRVLFLLSLVSLSLPGLVYAGGDQQITKDGYIDPKANELCSEKSCAKQAVIDNCKYQFEEGLKEVLAVNCNLAASGKTWTCSSSDPNKGMVGVNQFIEDFKKWPAYEDANLICIQWVPGQKFYQWCGDGKVNADEECDDKNVADGDGCSAKCELEVPVDVDATCYQEKHDGPCKEQFDMCGNNQNPSQCGSDHNACLADALSACQKPAITPKDKPPAPDTKKEVPATTPRDALSGGGCPLQMVPGAGSGRVNFFWVAMLLLPALRFRPRA